MRLGRMEILLVALMVCGALYMAAQYLAGGGAKTCSPLTLSPEVKAYIDQRLASLATPTKTADNASMLARVNGLEAKLGSLDKYKELRESVNTKREAVDAAVRQRGGSEGDALAGLRNEELSRLRSEMATMCSGVNVRSKPAANVGAREGKGKKRRGRKGGAGNSDDQE